jgi:predicted HTH domain antitoxin
MGVFIYIKGAGKSKNGATATGPAGLDFFFIPAQYIHIWLHIWRSTMKRTNILLDDEQHRLLKSYAQKEKRTLGGLVREAIDTTYGKKDSLDLRRDIALNAYQEGMISLGKLAEVLGLDPHSTRLYLQERRIPLRVQNVEDVRQDAAHA